jgi:arylsulfatase A-like enzyme
MKAALIAAAIDVVALRHAWASWPERAAVAAGIVALLMGAALLVVPWLRALAAAPPLAAAVAALPPALLLGVALGDTHRARSLVGPMAPLLLVVTLAGVLLVVPRLSHLGCGRYLHGRQMVALLGMVLLLLDASLPARLYPALRATCSTIGFVALACAWAGPALPPARPRLRDALTAAVAVALLAAGQALVSVSANARFIAHAQAPAAGLVLDGLARLRPERSAVAGTVAAPASGTPRAPAPPPPLRSHRRDALLGDAHFVLVTVDALRADRMRPETMPRTTALGARSVLYTRAYATAPSTAASIASLLTGRAPAHLDARPPTLADVARARGWFTEAFYPAGLFFDGGGALAPYAAARFGFAWTDTRTLAADALTDAVLARVQALERDHEPRAFLWAHFFDPHEPYERHDLPADAPAAARYDAECAAVDAALERLINGLTILARPTLLVIAADHGEELGEHGGAYHGSSLYDEQLRVPLLFVVVGGSGAAPLPPRRLATPVSLVDVATTAAALLDLPLPDGDGVTLAPDNGTEPPPHDLHATVHTQRLLLRDQWKLIHDQRRDLDELYDLAVDPAEQRNLADARRDLTAMLRSALEQWLNQSSPAQLIAILSDGARAPPTRAAAARELGAREAYAATAALRAALDDPDASVRAEAALALGQLSDQRARPSLRALLDDAALSARAAIMLGRLRDPAAASALAALCRAAPAAGDGETAAASQRRDAAHYLGFVGDAGAVAPLLAAAADPRARGSAYVALGRIAGRLHDRAAADALLARFAVEDHADARADLAWALGLAGDARAIAPLVAAAAADPPLPRAAEALIRLGAPARGAVGGGDLACQRRAVPPPLEAALDDWLGITSCTVAAAPLRLRLRLRATGDADVVLLRARARAGDARLTVILDGTALPPVALGPRFRELRLVRPLPPPALKPLRTMVKPIVIELRSDGPSLPIEIDHLLLVPQMTPTRL